jgi:hypothetical protein
MRRNRNATIVMSNGQKAGAPRGGARAIHFLTFLFLSGVSFAGFVLLVCARLTSQLFLIAAVFGGAVGAVLGLLFGWRQRERICSELLADGFSSQGYQRNLLLTLVEFGPFSVSVLNAQIAMFGGGLTDLALLILLGTSVQLACTVASKSLIIVTRLRATENRSSGQVWINATRKGPLFELTTNPKISGASQ